MKKILITLLIALLTLPTVTFAQFTKVQGGTGIPTAASGTLLISTASALRYTAISTTTLYDLLEISSRTSLSTTTIRGLFSNTATGLTFATSTGITSLTSGYIIPLIASTTEWSNPAWFTSGTNVYLATSTNNVGIGTSSPDKALTITGDQSLGILKVERYNASTLASLSTIQIKGRSTGTMANGFGTNIGFFVQGSSTPEYQAGFISSSRESADNTHGILIQTSNAGSLSEKFRITGAGFVGIGTSTPTQLLNVAGGYSLLNGLRISGLDTSNSIYQATGALGITTTNGNALNLGDLTNGVGLSVLNGNVTVGNGSALSNVKLNVTGTVTSANNAFGLYMGAMTLTPTTAWDAYFQYAGGGAVGTGASATIPRAVAFYAAPMTKSGSGTITNTYGLYVANSTSGTNNYGGYFQGSVGIGTTTPFRSLQVGGGNANDYIRIASDSRRYDIGIGSAVSGDDKFTLYDATSAAFRMVVDTNGNLGIGTVSPNRKVEIVEPGGQLLRLAYDDTSLANYDFLRNVTTGALSIQGSQVGFNNIALAPTSGNVGIGTSTPTRKFVVEGIASGVASLLVNNAVGSEMSTINVASNNSYSALVFAQGGTSRGFFGANGSVALIPGAVSGDFLVRSETGDMRFSSNTGTSPTLTLLRNQFVGIGTSTPTTQLHVTSSSTNATTTVTVGRSGMTKGSCLELYRADGSAIYAFVAAGATTFTLTTTSCK